jgi:hypothetical protein
VKNWLIRHPDLSFERPVSEADLIRLIETGKLGPRDEICRSGSYWFHLQDAQEVRKFLQNVKLEAILPKMADRTSTSLVTDTRAKGVDIRGEQHRWDSPSPVHAQLEWPEANHEDDLHDDSLDESSLKSRILFVGVILVIFFGTLYLLWSGSR